MVADIQILIKSYLLPCVGRNATEADKIFVKPHKSILLTYSPKGDLSDIYKRKPSIDYTNKVIIINMNCYKPWKKAFKSKFLLGGLIQVCTGGEVEEEEEDEVEEPEKGEDQERDKAVHQEKMNSLYKFTSRGSKFSCLSCSQ